MKWKLRLFTAAAVLAAIFAGVTIAAAAPGGSPSGPDIDPDDFVRVIDNRYFPLRPGTTFIYEGESDGTPTRNETTVTGDTRVILGVTCTVVHDQAFEEGVLVEDTFDWYAQDEDGNVWYFGEDTKELDEEGNVISTEGSWEAGVDGARPGILMEAHPKVGDRYHQEFYRGVAEDQAKVLELDESICVEYGCFDHVLVTREWTRLDPGVVENKYYARGVGLIYEETVKHGDETSELVEIQKE
jgi:hypothetical protein